MENRSWFHLLPLPFLALGAHAAEKRVSLVLGFPEGIDLRLGLAWKQVGVSITPGAGLFIASKFRRDEVLTTSWNPGLWIDYSIDIDPILYLRPNIGAAYAYGMGGSLSGSCMDCGTTRTRKDFLYTREGLALGTHYDGWFAEVDAGALQYQRFESIDNKDGAHYDIGVPFRPDGLGWYLAVGRYF